MSAPQPKLKGADVVWRAVAGHMGDSNPAAAENAALAAAALCSVLPAGSHALVTEAVQKLQDSMTSQ